jgi:ElaB/YqjD/DUF883 family membrane-anchored ribosome-binding protein
MMEHDSDASGWLNAEWLTRAVRRNPEGLLLLGAGLALMMRSRGSADAAEHRHDSSAAHGYLHGTTEAWASGTSQASDALNRGAQQGAGMLDAGMHQASEATDRGMEAGRDVVGSGREAMNSAMQQASDAMQSGRGAAADAINKGREAISSGMQQASETASGYLDTASQYAKSARTTIAERSARMRQQSGAMLKQGNEFVHNQPLAVVALGLGAGLALAAMLPSVEIEERMMGPARGKLMNTARGAGERVARATGAAGSELVHAMDKRGFNQSGVKEMIHEVASSFTGALADHDRAQAAHDAAERHDGAPGRDTQARP